MLRFSCFVGGVAASLMSSTLLAQPTGRLFVGTDTGVFAEVRRFDRPGNIQSAAFFPYGTNFTGGVRVAVADVNNDGLSDIITGVGPGATSHVKAFSGADNSELRSFFAFTPSFTGGVYVAAGDINGDHFADIITGAGSGAVPQVSAFSGSDGAPIANFLAYGATFSGGVRVSAGDVNDDGTPDIITASGPGSAGHVKAFSGASGAEIRSFFPYGTAFMGGVFVASGDVNGDGVADIITGPDAGALPQVSIFSGTDLSSLGSFSAYSPTFLGGVRVAAGDVTGDGLADIITGTGPGAAEMRIFRGGDLQQIDAFLPYGPSFAGGIFVAAVPEPAGALAIGALLAAGRARRRG